MLGNESENFSNHVLHFGSTLHGTCRQRQRGRLTAMVDSVGLPTAFFILDAADLQWPELAHLLDFEDPLNGAARSRAVIGNPCMPNWFFYQHIIKFMDAFYMDIMGAKDYWFRFEYQHRGSPHIHGLQDAPDAQNILPIDDPAGQEELIKYIDRTTNPAVLQDGTNVCDAPPPKLDPHICNQSYLQVEDYQQDLNDLIATCQKHT